MSLFRIYDRKPTSAEAVQFTDENKQQVFNDLSGNIAPDFEDGKPVLKVTTIHGDIAVVRIGDWIAKEPKLGCYYPILGDYFRDNFMVEETSESESQSEDRIYSQADMIEAFRHGRRYKQSDINESDMHTAKDENLPFSEWMARRFK